MIRSCNIAIYYRLLIKILFQFGYRVERLGSSWMKMDFAYLTVAVMICFLSVLARQNIIISWQLAKVVQKWVGLCRVQSFVLILGRVAMGHFTCGSDWVGSRKFDPRPIKRSQCRASVHDAKAATACKAPVSTALSCGSGSSHSTSLVDRLARIARASISCLSSASPVRVMQR